ncbi:MAG: hypothetical protein V9G29_01425 [Burkholderiaceae bacterium]
MPTPRVPHSMVARRRSVASAYCSISAALAAAIEIGGMFIGLPDIGHLAGWLAGAAQRGTLA